jgi:hypothetical protein
MDVRGESAMKGQQGILWMAAAAPSSVFHVVLSLAAQGWSVAMPVPSQGTGWNDVKAEVDRAFP